MSARAAGASFDDWSDDVATLPRDARAEHYVTDIEASLARIAQRAREWHEIQRNAPSGNHAYLADLFTLAQRLDGLTGAS